VGLDPADVINRMLAKAPGINELRNLLCQILHERDAEGKKDIILLEHAICICTMQ
jgi:hypothetical protein